jgi:hypothetical protein
VRKMMVVKIMAVSVMISELKTVILMDVKPLKRSSSGLLICMMKMEWRLKQNLKTSILYLPLHMVKMA